MKLTLNRTTPFYDMLESQAQQASLAATTFYSFVSDFRDMPEALQKIEQIEHDGDSITRDFVKRINSHYFTPMDREDLHGITDRIDDITDAIESAAGRMGIYHLPSLAMICRIWCGCWSPSRMKRRA
jgi:predicted phosphate transport protein (TIGR00153 family)